MVNSFPAEPGSSGAYSLVQASSNTHVAASEANSDVGSCWQAAETLDPPSAFKLAKKIWMKPVAVYQASFSTASTEELLHWASQHPGPGKRLVGNSVWKRIGGCCQNKRNDIPPFVGSSAGLQQCSCAGEGGAGLHLQGLGCVRCRKHTF
jgi:hypothetical protein